MIYFYVYPILLIPLCPILYWQSQAHIDLENDAHPINPNAIWAETFDFSGAEIYIYFYAMFILSVKLFAILDDADSDEFPIIFVFVIPIAMYFAINIVLVGAWAYI